LQGVGGSDAVNGIRDAGPRLPGRLLCYSSGRYKRLRSIARRVYTEHHLNTGTIILYLRVSIDLDIRVPSDIPGRSFRRAV
jgi:hypothetical protein